MYLTSSTALSSPISSFCTVAYMLISLAMAVRTERRGRSLKQHTGSDEQYAWYAGMDMANLPLLEVVTEVVVLARQVLRAHRKT
jgi:hypothetical protein